MSVDLLFKKLLKIILQLDFCHLSEKGKRGTCFLKKIMKQLTLILFVFLLKGMSCQESPVVFGEPQPKDLPSKAYFEPIYRGVFFCDSDSSMVHVHATTVFKEKAYSAKILLDEIQEDSTLFFDLKNGFLTIKNHNEPFHSDLIGDTVHAEIVLRDTLFEIGRRQVLKHFRGHHILNRKVENNRWEVEVLSLVGDLDLRYAKAQMPEDLEQLEKITPVKKKDLDTRNEQIIIAPTVLEFNEILTRELIFNECDYFTRQQLPASI